MNFSTEKIHVPLWIILSLTVGLAAVACGIWYYKIDPSHTKELGLAGGLLTGFIVYLATFLTLLRPIQKLDKLQRLGVKELLSNRHDKNYYTKLVAKSKFRVDVLGASCRRFVSDFLDENSDEAVLISALDKRPNLKVRLLIPSDDYMGTDAASGIDATMRQMASLKNRFEGRVELRRFNEEARHSFVIADNDLVAGPIFEGDNSRHEPAVHVEMQTPFGQKYGAYFDTLWETSQSA